MELYLHDAALARLQARLGTAGAEDRPGLQVAIAWHLRQRETARAEALAAEVARILAPGTALAARALLTRAECAQLFARLGEAETLAHEAQAAFSTLPDAAGEGDCALLLARIAEAKGERAAELSFHWRMLEAYRAAGDAERLAHGRCVSLLAQGLSDPAAMAADIAAIRTEYPDASEAVATHLRFVEGVANFQRGALLEAVPALSHAATRAFAWGLCDQGFRAEAGLVSAHSNLGDREAASAMAERVLARARSLGWPRAIGHSLSNFGRQLHDAGEHARAVEMFLEAREVLADQPRSRGFAITAYYLGDAYLALGRHADALAQLELAGRLMQDLGALTEVSCLLAIQAQALSRMGRPADALARAEAGLGLARKTGARLWEAEALRSLAEIRTRHRVEGEEADRKAAIAYLDQALAVAEAVGGHHEKSQLYAEIGRAREAAGDLAGALAAERAAHAEALNESNRRAANRLLLARERHEAERQAERARALEASLETLEQLRQVGQEITSHLDADEMLHALDRQLTRLADVSYIAVLMFDAAGGRLTRHAIERGRMLPVRSLDLEDAGSYAARAARERREIHVEAAENERFAARVPGTEPTSSLWYAPLARGEELLGVLTVQTPTPRAYGEREKLIFRTVAGYAAVAIANARAHGELEAKHQRLIRTEAEMRELATTDALTGLANRRQFFASAQSELARAMRYGGAVGIVMADLDRFKAVNDEGGHRAGDRLLQAVAAALRAEQRPHDVLARLGGEEFALVLPGADLDATVAVAERLRNAVQSTRIDDGGRRFGVTMSLGCAAVADARGLERDPAQELEVLVRAADGALYEAKRLGRNRSVAATPPLPPRSAHG